MDGHYESADGSPQPKKVDNTVAPVRSDRPHTSFFPYDCRLSTFPLLHRLHYTHLYICLLCLPIFLLFVCRRQVPSVTTVQNIVRHKTIPSPYLWTSSVNHQNKMEDSDKNNNKNRQMAYYLRMKSLMHQSRGNGCQQPLHSILNQICKLLLHLWTWYLNNNRHWRRREQMKLVVDVASAL